MSECRMCCFFCNLSCNFSSLERVRKTNSGIPVWVCFEPLAGSRVKTFHRNFWKQQMPCFCPTTNKTLVHHDVGIEDLTRLGINAAGTNCKTHVRICPENEVVPRIFRIFFHVRSRRGVLLIHLDCIDDSYLFIRLVPLEHAVPNPSAISDWNRVLQVKHDWLFWWTHLQLWISLLKMPPCYVPNPWIIVRWISNIFVCTREIPDTVICNARLIPGVFWNGANGI